MSKFTTTSPNAHHVTFEMPYVGGAQIILEIISGMESLVGIRRPLRMEMDPMLDLVTLEYKTVDEADKARTFLDHGPDNFARLMLATSKEYTYRIEEGRVVFEREEDEMLFNVSR